MSAITVCPEAFVSQLTGTTSNPRVTFAHTHRQCKCQVNTQALPHLISGTGYIPRGIYNQAQARHGPFLHSTHHDNVPLPLRNKVELEIRRMEALGVIKKVDEPTPLCARMVVVPKKSGDVRMQLNQSVLREVHPLPKLKKRWPGSQEQPSSAN